MGTVGAHSWRSRPISASTLPMLTLVVWLIAVPPSLALLYFSSEVLLGLRPLPARAAARPDLDLAVIIPAHNEELLIGSTVQALRQQDGPATRVVVVADNCSDRTAEVARVAGATVIERNDASQRGKGFALAFAREFLASAPPEAVFILDADCKVSKGSVEALACLAASIGEPVQ